MSASNSIGLHYWIRMKRVMRRNPVMRERGPSRERCESKVIHLQKFKHNNNLNPNLMFR
jgi:hypothetical protein